jgi:copper chaperone CopZ
MKAFKYLSILFISLIGFQFSNAQTITDSVMVNGNCGMCKKTIEKNAISAGAETATWNKTTKFLTVNYDPSKSNTDKIQQSVANAGYDTQNFKANDKAYKSLEECCQYDRSKELKGAKK